jgi:hypothetical protein
MVNTYMKFSIFLAVKEMQIKTILTFHLIPIRTATSNACEDMGESNPLLVGIYISAATMEIKKSVWRLLKKLKLQLTYDPANSSGNT